MPCPFLSANAVVPWTATSWWATAPTVTWWWTAPAITWTAPVVATAPVASVVSSPRSAPDAVASPRAAVAAPVTTVVPAVWWSSCVPVSTVCVPSLYRRSFWH